MIARDFEQLTSITGSAPHSLLYLPAVRAYTRARSKYPRTRSCNLVNIRSDVRVTARYYLSH